MTPVRQSHSYTILKLGFQPYTTQALDLALRALRKARLETALYVYTIRTRTNFVPVRYQFPMISC